MRTIAESRITGSKSTKKTKLMSEMKPCEICRIIDSKCMSNKHIVMRTAHSDKFEIMDLTILGENSCWTEFFDVTVEPVEPDFEITLKVRVEEE